VSITQASLFCSHADPRASTLVSPLRARAFWLVLLACALGACGGGQYGFARTYSPLASEQTHFDQAEEATYQDLLRDPRRFAKTEVGWFGTVSNVAAAADGRARLTLNLRAHQARHLCAEDSRSSCRVTVSEAQLGVFTVDLALKPDEINGKERIWVGSLLKVYGTHSGEYSEETGPVLNVSYYRHWPRGLYVTTAARGSMRR
jgi:hypothetical protein